MKFEFATVEVKKFDLEDILTASSTPAETTQCMQDFSDCLQNTTLPCIGD